MKKSTSPTSKKNKIDLSNSGYLSYVNFSDNTPVSATLGYTIEQVNASGCKGLESMINDIESYLTSNRLSIDDYGTLQNILDEAKNRFNQLCADGKYDDDEEETEVVEEVAPTPDLLNNVEKMMELPSDLPYEIISKVTPSVITEKIKKQSVPVTNDKSNLFLIGGVVLAAAGILLLIKK